MGTGEACVLLVVGEGAVARAMEETLVRGCYAVNWVTTGEAAARALQAKDQPVALVLIDTAIGNVIAPTATGRLVLSQTDVPVVALALRGGDDGDAPRFRSYGCVAQEWSVAVLGAALQTALRIFQEQQGAAARLTDRDDAASRAKLGHWEYDPHAPRFHGTDVVHQILDLALSTETALDSVSQMYISQPPGVFQRAVELALKDGKSFSLVSEIETPTGKRKWVQTHGKVGELSGNALRKVSGTIQDISELRLLDRVTQETEMTLNQVEQITRIGHWSVSLADGSFYHSDEIKRIFGYEPSEYALSVEDAINAYHPDDRDELLRFFNRAVETGEGYEFDLRVIQPTGDVRHVHSKGYTEQNEQGKVSRVYGVFQDITDQVNTELALRESEASMKALVDGVRTAIVVHGKEGEVLLSNQMANRLLAPLAAGVVGKDLTDPAWRFVFEDGRDVPLAELPVSHILRTQEPVENLVLGRRAGDSVGWLLVNGVPVLDKNGELTKIIISFVEITEHKEMEERLHQAEKMKATGQLAGGVAHDFNNQLMVMSTLAEMLQDSLPKGASEQAWVDGILSAVSRSADLTKQLLAFARKGKYVVTTLDLSALVSEVASMAGHSFDKKIRITHRKGPGLATIAGDVSQMQNALLNMALNSRDSMPQGGELLFLTEQVTIDATSRKHHGLDVEPGKCVKVTIKDTGMGMDAATLKQIFEPFFTTKGPGKGTGMGMASVYGTVKNHHGEITVESEPGEGTTITMHFPLVLADRSKPEALAPPVDTAGGRILIVDDEEGVTLSMSTMLTRKGYLATTCSSGRDAVREFTSSWQNTDLVLLDMIMPDMNGLETFHALKLIDPNVQVVLISGYSFTEETKKIRENGAAGFLVKPVSSKEVLQVISDVIRQKRAGAR